MVLWPDDTMDERRNYFRVKNSGEMIAKCENETIKIIDLAANSVAIVNPNNVPPIGTMKLNINTFSISLEYELCKASAVKTVLVFKNEEQIDKLFPVLKRIRNEHNKV